MEQFTTDSNFDKNKRWGTKFFNNLGRDDINGYLQTTLLTKLYEFLLMRMSQFESMISLGDSGSLFIKDNGQFLVTGIASWIRNPETQNQAMDPRRVRFYTTKSSMD